MKKGKETHKECVVDKGVSLSESLPSTEINSRPMRNKQVKKPDDEPNVPKKKIKQKTIPNSRKSINLKTKKGATSSRRARR